MNKLHYALKKSNEVDESLRKMKNLLLEASQEKDDIFYKFVVVTECIQIYNDAVNHNITSFLKENKSINNGGDGKP